MSQAIIWRKSAVELLVSTMQGLSLQSPTIEDEVIDGLIRDLQSLPKRPFAKPPYNGIFGTQDVKAGRKKAGEFLRSTITKFANDVEDRDFFIDGAIRVINRLAPLSRLAPPYADLFPKSNFLEIKAKELSVIAPYASRRRVTDLVPYLNLAMAEFEINTRLRQAHFIAQLAHESGSFNYLEEIASGEDYEWREDLGNTQKGDGKRFKGRGLIQVTGRHNYGVCGKALNVDLIAKPEQLLQYDLACRSAGWFWKTNHLNAAADLDDVRAATRIINGGLNGFEERKHFLMLAKSHFGLLPTR